MIAVKNPDNGAEIIDVVNVGKGPVEYKHPVGETIIYEDEVAKQLLTKFGFLEKFVIKEGDAGFKCPYCDYTNMVQIGVYAHMRHGHKDKEKAKAVRIDPNINIAQGKKIMSLEDEIRSMQTEELENLKEKMDPTRVAKKSGFYGPGLESDDGKVE